MKKKERLKNFEKKEERKTNVYAKESEIRKAIFLYQPMIILLYNKAFLNTKQLDDASPSSIVSIMQKFEDVFPKKIPNDLIRGIEHQIDFVLGANIPNRPACRSNPEETKELQT